MLSIALVEDDDKAAETLSKFLDTFSSTHGTQFKITRFSDPTILLEDYKPVWDIVFMDIEMPNMNGMDAAYALRELQPKISAYFCNKYGTVRCQRLRSKRSGLHY